MLCGIPIIFVSTYLGEYFGCRVEREHPFICMSLLSFILIFVVVLFKIITPVLKEIEEKKKIKY